MHAVITPVCRRIAGGFILLVGLFPCAFPLTGVADGQSSSNAVERPIFRDAAAVLKDLEGRFSGIRTVQAPFREEKRMLLFNDVITIDGTIYLEQPDRFAWHATSPVEYTMTLIGDQVTQWDGDSGQIQRFSLSDSPVFRVISEQMRNWFSGRYSSLTNEYSVTVGSTDPAVELEFIPRAASIAGKAVRSINVLFMSDKRYLKRIAINDVSGDTTTMVFGETRLNEPVSPEVWKAGPGKQ